ncbi:cytochrome d ubiquinol oxidase subunit II [Pseudonocardia humida]|uniref:Cytochrome d ubiquinol oxidase subunit II n=1 Tax=Pseudonocardia humida TaxID=2800819 RepID=A0ABT1ADC6_9PSEU|nr:cytochrome d ubiquinol oxidase subunit II [Pseudonocardia humida]MCO1661075.1 cytochrome d ubiquinol oxidase subunit II [Pseudonocardia humida]
MALADVMLAVLWLGLTAYVLFGGADFGGGFWDLLAGDARRGAAVRAQVEHSIGPVWEANHVWLIFVIVMLWTGFPSVFAAVASTLYIPLTLVALGIIARGAAFAFRKVSDEPRLRRLFGAAFAFSSVATPFFLGTTAGAIASGRVPPGIAAGDLLGSWLNPTSMTTGVLAVGVTAYLAAVYLTLDARREGATELAEGFRRRATATGVVVGAISVVGLAVLRTDAPALFAELSSWPALPVVGMSVAAGLVSLALLRARAYLAVRISASLAVVGVLWAWAVAQYPVLLPGVTVEAAAATDAVLAASLGALAVGALLLVPSLWWLYRIFQRTAPESSRTVAPPRADTR